MIAILTEQNVSRSLAQLRAGDIYIKPELDGITAGDFSRHAEAAERGRAAAEAAVAHLARLSQPAEDYAAWWQGIEVRRRTSPRIDEVQIVGLNKVNPAAVERHLHVEPGQTIRPSEINRDLLRMYGDGWYESVDYALLSERDRNILQITPVEKS